MERITQAEWRKQNETTRYPFSERATMTNENGRVILEGTILDASIYPIGGLEGLYLSQVVVTHQTVTVYVGDDEDELRCSGSFALVTPDDNITLRDAAARPAGLLISDANRLSVFQSWGIGTHTFKRPQSEFCASVCVPTPQIGVRGIQLEDGTVMVGDIWLVGDDGVVFRVTTDPLPQGCDQPALPIRYLKKIRMDVVGDPLFRRRLCSPTDLFSTPQFIKTLRVVGPNQEFECTPDDLGNLQMLVNNDLATDTVLRVVNTVEGVKIGAVGQVTQR